MLSPPKRSKHQLGRQPKDIRRRDHILAIGATAHRCKAKMLSMPKAQMLSPPKRSKHQLGRQPKDMRRRDHILAIGATAHRCKAKMLSMPKEGSHQLGCQPKDTRRQKHSKVFCVSRTSRYLP